MSSQTETILNSLYAVLNMTISVIIGFILAKMNVLTQTTRKVVSDVNYYALIPIFCLVFIMQAIDRNHLNELFLLLASTMPAIIVGMVLTYGAAILFRFDIRMRSAYTFINAYGNLVVMPQLLASSFCEKGGKYGDTPQCKAGLVNAYTSVPMIFINILYWATVLPVLQEEKRIANAVKKIYLIVLNYYPTINEFMNDPNFRSAKITYNIHELENINDSNQHHIGPEKSIIPHLTKEEDRESEKSKKTRLHEEKQEDDQASKEQAVIVSTNQLIGHKKAGNQQSHSTNIELFEGNHNDLVKSDNERFIHEYYDNIMNMDFFDNLQKRFSEFETTIYNTNENLQAKLDIEKYILMPENVDRTLEKEKIFSFRFLKNRILMAPPTVCSLLGILFGFIFPVKEFLFDPANKPIPMFLNTLRNIGNMMSPVSMFMLGTYLAQSSVISQTMFIRWKHVILSNIIKNMVMPALGLLWCLFIIRWLNPHAYAHNNILVTIDYLQWIVPNGLVLISVYVVADYFAKEFAVLSIYMNLLAIPAMAIFLVVFFNLYETSIA